MNLHPFDFWPRARIAVLGITFFSSSSSWEILKFQHWIPVPKWTPVLNWTFAFMSTIYHHIPTTRLPPDYHMLTICLPYAHLMPTILPPYHMHYIPTILPLDTYFIYPLFPLQTICNFFTTFTIQPARGHGTNSFVLVSGQSCLFKSYQTCKNYIINGLHHIKPQLQT